MSIKQPTDGTLIDAAANSVVYLKPEDLPLVVRAQATTRSFIQRTRIRRADAVTLLAHVWRTYVTNKEQVEINSQTATIINTVLRRFMARKRFLRIRSELRAAAKIQAARRGTTWRRELRLKHKTAEYVQQHMRMLIVRRRLDKQNFAAYRIQGWFRQYRKDWFEKIVHSTKSVVKKVFSRPKFLAVARAAVKKQNVFQKVGSLFRNIFQRKRKDAASDHHSELEDAAASDNQNVFQKAGGFFARVLRLKNKAALQSKRLGAEESVADTYQRRLRQMGETKMQLESEETKSPEPPKRLLDLFRKRKKGAPKRTIGSMFKAIFTLKKKTKPRSAAASEEPAAATGAKKRSLKATFGRVGNKIKGILSFAKTKFKRLQDDVADPDGSTPKHHNPQSTSKAAVVTPTIELLTEKAPSEKAPSQPTYDLADSNRDDDKEAEDHWSGRRSKLRGFGRKRGVDVAPVRPSPTNTTASTRRRTRSNKGFRVRKRRIHGEESFKNNIKGRGFARAVFTSGIVQKAKGAFKKFRKNVKRNLKVDLRNANAKTRVHPPPF